MEGGEVFELDKPPLLSSNTAKLAVGIVTANEYYGTFKGTIDSNVTISSD